jgi:hypothetical protein
VAEVTRCAEARMEGRAREWCREVWWRPGAVLALYRRQGGAVEAVNRAVTTGLTGFKPLMAGLGL